jgi:hypothetical protein
MVAHWTMAGTNVISSALRLPPNPFLERLEIDSSFEALIEPLMLAIRIGAILTSFSSSVV